MSFGVSPAGRVGGPCGKTGRGAIIEKRDTFTPADPAMLDLALPAAVLLQAPPDFMRSTGKIYVVVAVIALVLLGLFAFVWTVDRRLTKLENQVERDDERSAD